MLRCAEAKPATKIVPHPLQSAPKPGSATPRPVCVCVYVCVRVCMYYVLWVCLSVCLSVCTYPHRLRNDTYTVASASAMKSIRAMYPYDSQIRIRQLNRGLSAEQVALASHRHLMLSYTFFINIIY